MAAAIHDPDWALGILEAWFGTDREFVVAADELLKGVTERNEAATTKVLQVGDGPVQLQGGVWLYGELDDTGEDMRDAAKCLVDVVLAAASRVRLRKPALTLPKKRGEGGGLNSWLRWRGICLVQLRVMVLHHAKDGLSCP